MPLSDLQYIPGIGPKRAELLETECNIHSLEDLLGYYPYRYVDKSKVYRICDIPAMNPSPGSGATLPFILLKGRFTLFTEEAPQEKSHVRNWRSKGHLAPLMRPTKCPEIPVSLERNTEVFRHPLL